MCPIGRAGGDHRAACRVDAQHRVSDPVLGKPIVPVAVAWSPPRWTGAENLKRLRRAIFAGRLGKTIDPFDFATVAFVPDDRIFTAELAALFQVGPCENPVIGAMDCE